VAGLYPELQEQLPCRVCAARGPGDSSTSTILRQCCSASTGLWRCRSTSAALWRYCSASTGLWRCCIASTGLWQCCSTSPGFWRERIQSARGLLWFFTQHASTAAGKANHTCVPAMDYHVLSHVSSGTVDGSSHMVVVGAAPTCITQHAVAPAAHVPQSN
jgi:hypothetical protein